MWTYHTFKFDNKAQCLQAVANAGWSLGTPPSVDLSFLGEVPGETGYFLSSAFRDEPFPPAWANKEVAPPPNAPVFGERTVLAQEDYAQAVDDHVERVARLKGYKTAANCASYFNSTHPVWRPQAAKFIVWRDAVWEKVFQTLAEVSGGAAPPTIKALLSSLPKIGWPGE